MKALILLLIFSLKANALESQCKLETFPHIIKINKVLTKEAIKSSNCPDQIKNQFINIIASANGKVNSSYISQTISNKISVEISPKSFVVSDLLDHLNNFLNDEERKFLNVSALHSKSFFSAPQNSQIQFECKDCLSPGRKNVKIHIGKRNYWISGELAKKTTLYKVKRPINSQTPFLSKNDFQRVTSFLNTRSQYFSDIENIKFYKATKNLNLGEKVKSFNLRPKNIISRGQKVKVLVQNDSVTINTVGKAMSNGKIGEFINIQNMKSKKTTLAKVIDYNKVVIEL